MASNDEAQGEAKDILTVLIVNQDKTIYEGDAESIIAPGKDNTLIGILPFHTPFYTKLYKGSLILNTITKEEKTFEIESGIARVINNNVVILVGF